MSHSPLWTLCIEHKDANSVKLQLNGLLGGKSLLEEVGPGAWFLKGTISLSISLCLSLRTTMRAADLLLYTLPARISCYHNKPTAMEPNNSGLKALK